MTFNQFAKSQMPKGAGQRRQKVRCRAPSGSSSQTIVFEGLALVQKLIQMGEKEQAVRLYRQIKN